MTDDELRSLRERYVIHLTAAQRQALDLRLAGWTYEQIGEALGCSKSAAHARVGLGRGKLRRLGARFGLIGNNGGA